MQKPRIASREDCLQVRLALLAHEKAFTMERDDLAWPMAWVRRHDHCGE
jgi:predicted dithiol-disulfide oxidoreductase (DUF899 family)